MSKYKPTFDQENNEWVLQIPKSAVTEKTANYYEVHLPVYASRAFLDPYAMDLEWASLNKISNTEVFDVWYLFPFMALNRNFYKNGKMPLATKKKIDRILGTNDWETIIYSHIWMGVSVEDSEHVYRVNQLLQTSAATKFLSLEPLLGPISGLNLAGIDWVIAGGESGPYSRLMEAKWVTFIRDQC